MNCLFKKILIRGDVLMAVFPHSLGRWPLDFLSAIMNVLILANTVLLYSQTFLCPMGGVGMMTYLRDYHNIFYREIVTLFLLFKTKLPFFDSIILFKM